ncbi:hypothetical protein EMPS_05228 [Entomortierella parvispora]|uniref:F-box domain-containing protein n=1 Tax=Entomortierella parvispora TaxID=205924 RepID=A0A9P3HA14_9FUNG|nr:hypothetical protein EMPS_05228 [Entomortierella parvispora]
MPSSRRRTLADYTLASILFTQHQPERVNDATESTGQHFYSTSSDLDDSELENPDNPWDQDIIFQPKTTIQRSKPSSRQRRRQRSLALSKSHSLHPRAMPLIPVAAKPLIFPLEVLEMVCHYLSQATLRSNASLVSRRWNAVCSPFIKRTVTWTACSDDHDQFVLDTLRDIKSLECWLNEDPDLKYEWLPYIRSAFRREAWEKFWPKLLVPIDQVDNSNIDSTERSRSVENSDNLCLMDTIRNLRVFCDVTAQPITVLNDLQSNFRSLRTLELRVNGNPSNRLSIFTLLDNSPELRQLKITGPDLRQLELISGDAEDDIIDIPEPVVDPETAHFPVKPEIVIPPNKSYPQRYRLEVFDVFQASAHQRVLERLISTCRELRILRFLEANAPQWRNGIGHVAKVLKLLRLFEHAKECCPRLVSMEVFPKAFEASDHIYLDQMEKFFPDATRLTLNCSGYLPTAPSLEGRRLLSQITFLEIRKVIMISPSSATFNRILCLTPQLLHLVCNELLLHSENLNFLPLVAEDQKRPQFISHNRTRKHAVREERRARRRESLMAIEQASERARLAREGVVSATLPEVPLYWQFHDLRTMDLSVTSILKLGEYAQQHQLFQKLTSLKLRVTLLMVGQLRKAPDCKKLPSGFKSKAKGVGQNGGNVPAETSSSTTATRTASQFGSLPDEVIPERHTDHLKTLHNLPSLELLVIYTQQIQGMVHSSDFEFLRRVPPSAVPVVSPPLNGSFSSSSSSSASPASSTPTEGVWPEDMVTFSPAEARVTEPEPAKIGHQKGDEEGQDRQQTCWPRLQMFKIRYAQSILPTDYSKVVAGMEQIRPGVEFQIKLLLYSSMNFN